MKTMKWLLRREFWQHKGSMFWAQIVVGAMMVLFVAASAIYQAGTGKLSHTKTVTMDGQRTTTTTSVNADFLSMPVEKQQQLANTVSSVYLIASLPMFVMLAAIAFYYCLGALSEERQDRSILFWKSLPVSDAQTVLSKVLTAALVAPLIAIGVGTFVSITLLLIVGTVSAMYGVNLFGMVLSNADFYLAPFRLLGMLPVYVLWALPTIGWLLMVSAWAKSKVFLWAVGAPVISIVVVKLANYTLGLGIQLEWFVHNVVGRCLAGLIPGIWLGLAKVEPKLLLDENHSLSINTLFAQSWMTLSTPAVWVGAIAGAAMIFAAMRLRRWKDEG